MSIAEKITTIAENTEKVYEAGKKIQQDEFWDAFQDEGRRTQYAHAFSGIKWKKEKTFKPKYDLIPVDATSMFSRHVDGYSKGYDLAEYLEQLGIVLDTSNLTETNANYMFDGARFNHLPVLNMQNVSQVSNLFRTTYLVKVDKLILNDKGDQNFTNTFLNCTALTDIVFEGVIGRSFPASWCPFSVKSLKSIITHLKDYSGTSEYTYTVTFKDSAFQELETAKFTDEDKVWLAENEIEYSENLTWAIVIDNLRWNLVLV